MDENRAAINWAKRALKFISQELQSETYEGWSTIMKKNTILLKSLAEADRLLIVKKEDEVTLSVVVPGESVKKKYIDPEALKNVNDQAIFSDMPFLELDINLTAQFKNAAAAVLIPFHEIDFQGCLVLEWDSQFDFNDDFKEFIQACLLKIKETLKLSRTYYALEELKVRFNSILQSVPQNIVFIDDSGKNSWINDKAAKLFGIPGGNVSPAVLAGLMQKLRATADNHEEISKKGQALFQSKDKHISDWHWIYSNPETRVLNVCSTPTISEHVSGRLWMFEDVTAKYLIDQHLKELNAELEEKTKLAESQNMAKSEFLANMSHEIRTPMNGVMGMTSLLDNTKLTEEQHDYVESIRISADSLLEIINEILDFSKIESGKLELEEHPFLLYKVIEETYDLMALKAQQKKLELLYLIDTDVPLEIIGDMTRIRQIIVNLVGNAIKFTEEGEILIRIKMNKRIDSLYELEFSVKDTGIGIPADKMHKLFTSFSQVDSSTTRKYGGTGLGLAISSRLVQKMNGHIRVESEEHVGTTFIFTIPVNANEVLKTLKPTPVQKDLNGKRALIIDDNHTNLYILKTHCALWGMHADIAKSGNEGLDCLAQNTYDVVVVDLLMPGMNGIDTAHEIRKKYTIPLVLFSSAGQFPGRNTSDGQLFAAILDKPIKPNYFHKVLKEVLSNAPEEKKADPVHAKTDTVTTHETEKVAILVAEDNLINQKIMVNAFKNIGLNCDVVSNGLEVLASLERQHYDLIYMDVQMPEMDGYEATRSVIKKYGDKRPVIIAMTAGAYEKDKQDCLNAGMDDYLSKPFDFDTFYAKFNKWKAKAI
ncbi:response regulator [Pedobacter metabolipauper]|uniref:histidine kinase n=1 Tax=Pedobacter metabolipauper TaxID=425513 RepID=A0A4R6SQC3_9SPHI|nr:response regulator [Pedobacter metabolipauper]TDQ06329.1 signal transduction histidine kinase [Pedobacter metabolipauper]